MFEHKNIFVLNKKDKEAIIYQDADGHIIRLTSAREFKNWKAWSDREYHNAKKARHLFSDNTLSLEGLSEEVAPALFAGFIK